MSNSFIGFEYKRQVVRRNAAQPVDNYRVDAAVTPSNAWIEIEGPGEGIRFLRCGSHSFESFSELAKTVTPPGTREPSDLEKALAVYRFATRNFHTFTMGWGGTEMTRFMNGFGYSFCWGQADFEHLLHEACGLKARAPMLKGHSSTEVLIDGRWRLVDAFMRALVPSAELDGLATGREMFEQPDRWDAMRDGGSLKNCREFWSIFGIAGTYEPFQDSRAMILNLRRGEKLRMDYAPLGQPCMSAYEPDDYLNGRWTWNATLDEKHLTSEVERHANVAAGADGLCRSNASQPAEIEYRVASPYPLVTGNLVLQFTQGGAAEVAISADGRKTWTDLKPAADMGDGLRFQLDDHTSSRDIPPSTNVAWTDYKPKYEAIVRVRWSGAAVLRRVGFDFVIQSHRPSVPRLEKGVNQWRLVGCETSGGITHAWDEYPGLRVSNDRPYEGDTVRIEADVHNRGAQPATNVPVRFIEGRTGATLGEVVVAHIEPKSKAVAALDWKAEIRCIERIEQPGNTRPYVRTELRVEIGNAASPASTGAKQSDELSSTARGVIVVRPRPRPMFNDGLVWSSDAREVDREIVTLRAAVVHLQGTDERPMLYLVDAELDVTLTPYLGHPDQGGLPLAPQRRLRAIQPSEFEVVEWELPIHGLPEEFEVWIEARCAQPVTAGRERLLAKRRVKLK